MLYFSVFLFLFAILIQLNKVVEKNDDKNRVFFLQIEQKID